MKTINGAPESITRDQVIAACVALGLDPNWTRAINISSDGYVEVVLHATQPATIKRDQDKCAEHTVFYDVR